MLEHVRRVSCALLALVAFEIIALIFGVTYAAFGGAGYANSYAASSTNTASGQFSNAGTYTLDIVLAGVAIIIIIVIMAMLFLRKRH